MTPRIGHAHVPAAGDSLGGIVPRYDPVDVVELGRTSVAGVCDGKPPCPNGRFANDRLGRLIPGFDAVLTELSSVFRASRIGDAERAGAGTAVPGDGARGVMPGLNTKDAVPPHLVGHELEVGKMTVFYPQAL